MEESTKEIVRRAATAVGSLREAEFDVRFNPDVFSPGVKHPDPNGPTLKKQKQLVIDAADFLLTVQIPTFVCFNVEYFYVYHINICLKLKLIQFLYHRSENV